MGFFNTIAAHSVDQNLGNITGKTAAPAALTDALLAFVQESKTSINYGESEDVWLTLWTGDAGANSVVVQPFAWNPNIGTVSAGINPAPSGLWVPLAKLNGGSAITGTGGFVYEQQLPTEALVGKTALYLQVSAVANITTLTAYIRARRR